MSFPKYPEYKDSGVEWFGDLPCDWRVQRLKQVVNPSRPITYGIVQAGENVPDGIPYIRPADMADESGVKTEDALLRTSQEIASAYRRSSISAGDIVCSIGPSFGKLMMVPLSLEGANLTQGTARVAVANEHVPRFIFWVLRSVESYQQWESSVGGATFRALNLGPLAETFLCVPSWAEQTQIARFLDHETARIDALIEDQQRLIELLKEKRQAVISLAVTKGLDPTVPMKDSGVEWLGEVPAHWEVKKLKHFGRVTGGFAFKSTEFTIEGHPVLKISNVGHLCFEWGDQSYLPDEFRESHSEFIAPKGALVFAMTRPVIAGGIKVARLEDDSLPLVNQRVGFMVVDDVDLSRYLLLSTQSDPFLNQFKNNLTVTNQPNISSEGIESISIAVPPLIDMKNILAFCQEFDTAVQSLIGDALQGSELLQERRSALISAAVTGKIDVRGWQPPASAPIPELVEEAV